MTIQHATFHASLAEQAKDRYPKIGFVVPAGAESIGVVVTVDDSAGVIDVGCEGAAGWRGWSGGARKAFTIAAQEATPGYVPGPLEPGLWHVVLGLHSLPRHSVKVTVEVSIPSQVPMMHIPTVEPLRGVQRGSGRDLPAPDGLTWFAGDFHSHTVHSDGALHIAELARLGVESGLDFMTVSDHNTISHHQYLPEVGREQGITLVPGQEVTTHRGHANAFGEIDWVDFRRPPATWVEQVERQGGVLSINHPIDGDCSWLHPLGDKPRAVELWHSTWYRELISTAPFAWYSAWSRGATLIGGSDFHKLADPPRPGTPTTWVAAHENTVPAIMEGIRAGRTAITGSAHLRDGVLTPELFDSPILLRVGDTLHALAADGLVLVDAQGTRTIVHGDEVSLAAPTDQGPYYLVNPDRTIVALSA